MSVYGTKSKTTKILAEFRSARFFQDDSVSGLYDDLELIKPEYDKDKKLTNPDQAGKPKNLKQYEGTKRDCYVGFKRTRIGADDKPLRELLHYQDMVDWPEYRKAVAELASQGESSEEADELYLKNAERTEGIYARAEYFTRKLVGPYLTLPKPEYETDEDGKQVLDEDGDPILINGVSNKDVYGDDGVPAGLNPKAHHAASGTIPPISHEWFELWDITVLVEYLNFMDAVHGGRSPVQEAQFPAGDVPADDGPAVPDGRRGKDKKPA